MTRELLSARRLFVSDFSDPLSVMNRLFAGWWCRDRFCFLNKYSPLKICNELDEDTKALLESEELPKEIKISDIIDAQAKRILAFNQPIAVSWSGGVDSTCVIVALLRNGLEPQDLTVIHAESSKEEYPFFYRWMLNHKVNLIEDNQVRKQYSRFEGKIVTGWCADQLFGSDIHLRNVSLYNEPWIDALKIAMTERNIHLTDKSFDVIESVYQEYASVLGLKLEQFCEFAWLYNFGCKWTYVIDESQLACEMQAMRDKFVPFFAHLDFQRYSLRRFSRLREVNVNQVNKFYKRPLKKYIYEYLNDANYLNNKGKKNSWALTEDIDTRVGIHDTEGYRQFKFKGMSEAHGVNYFHLYNKVRDLYLKDEYK